MPQKTLDRSDLPSIIQGGMGIGVSTWHPARRVAQRGEIGVISGTAIDSVVVRELQDGDIPALADDARASTSSSSTM